jgi:hypothetical protein
MLLFPAAAELLSVALVLLVIGTTLMLTVMLSDADLLKLIDSLCLVLFPSLIDLFLSPCSVLFPPDLF